jgi:hypothetical protein
VCVRERERGYAIAMHDRRGETIPLALHGCVCRCNRIEDERRRIPRMEGSNSWVQQAQPSPPAFTCTTARGLLGFGVQLCLCARPRRRRASLLPTLLHQGQTIIPVPYVRRRSKSPSPPACYLLVCYKVNPVSASPLFFSSSLRLLITALQLFGF